MDASPMIVAALKLINATSVHAPVFAALHKAAFEGSGTTPWEEASFTSLLARPGALALLATREDVPLAFVLAQLAGEEAEIITLGTLPQVRRQGVAQMLVGELKARVLETGASTIFLEVAADNPPAIALYQSAGFSRIGHRKSYYARPGGQSHVDALVMRCDIV
jgi:ribosomal-protein-alanine N-acetyltransferase